MEFVQKRNLFLEVDLDHSLPQAHAMLLRDAADATDEELTVFISLAGISEIARDTG
ncbi:hypothetical protein GGF43_000864, partial [Coemansia sp. RSA 2618]